MLRLGLFLILITGSICCRSGPQPTELSPAEVAKFEAPENSGKKLAGEFLWLAAEDDYGRGKDFSRGEARGRLSIVFDEGGGFRRQAATANGQSFVEEGSYIISKSDELVLFVEKMGGELLESARVERYLIKEQADSLLKVQADGAGSFILEKTK